MNRVLKSLESHKQNWESKHFEKTKYGKQLAALKNIHKGERCFVIGNGPSLTANDLQILHENQVITFATNRVYNIFEQTEWRPTYYVSEDVNVLRNVQDKASVVPAKKKIYSYQFEMV